MEGFPIAIELADLTVVAISIVVNVVINSLFVWLAGRSLVGGDKAKFSDAVWIVVLGSVIGAIIGAFLSGIVGTLVVLILWLGLIKHFFDCSWGKAVLIAILAIIIQVILSFIVGLLFGITLFTLGFF